MATVNDRGPHPNPDAPAVDALTQATLNNLHMTWERKIGNTEEYEQDCVKLTFQSVEAVDNWLAELRKQGNWNVKKSRLHANSNAGRQEQRRPNSKLLFLFYFSL